MVRLSVLYGAPADPEAFLSHYRDTHVPLATRIPGVRAFVWGRCLGSPTGEAPPYFLTAELTFDSMESLTAGMGSPEGEAAAVDVATFATGGVTMFVAESNTGV